MDIVEQCRKAKEYNLFDADVYEQAADEIERLREALQEYCDGQYIGYVTLPCGWDDAGTLAKFILEGKNLQDYINDCKYLAEKK